MSDVTVDEIVALVAAEFGLSPRALTSRSVRAAPGARKGRPADRLVDAVALAALLARRHTVNSVRAIGLALGGREAQATEWAALRIAERIERDPVLANMAERIETAIDALHEGRVAVRHEQGARV